ncbi:MAG: hypothetical protein HMLKMBBP_02624 [Planctomycetes bacterium]|nr:hypothetical protein [Planctomycetota bacterium]
MTRVTVLMTVKDGRRWIGAALASILAQEGADFDVVVVDDGSTDGTADAVRAAADPRVRLIVHDQNRGIAAALRTGMSAADAPYVARMDADDLAEPGRLASQTVHLDAHPDCGLVGTRVTTIGEDGAEVPSDYDPPADEALLLWNLLLFTNPVCHPSVMFRRSVHDAAGGYGENVPNSEDRDLWTRMLPHARIRNLDAKLLRYRQHAASFSVTQKDRQRAASLAVRRRGLAWLLGPDADTSSIERWYDDRIAPRDADALLALFRRTADALPGTGRTTPGGMDLVRADLARREESVRRRSASRSLAARILRRFTRTRASRARPAGSS